MLADLELAELDLAEANWSANGFQSQRNRQSANEKLASLISGQQISGTVPTTVEMTA